MNSNRVLQVESIEELKRMKKQIGARMHYWLWVLFLSVCLCHGLSTKIYLVFTLFAFILNTGVL